MTTKPHGRPEGRSGGTTLEASLGFRLGRAHRIVRAGWEEHIADLHLSGPQASVMRAVAEAPGVGLRELARTIGTDPMNVKRLADGLEEQGLLASGDDPLDHRRRMLCPTTHGVAVAEELRRRSTTWGETIHAILGPEDAARLGLILDRLEEGIACPGGRATARDEADARA